MLQNIVQNLFYTMFCISFCSPLCYNAPTVIRNGYIPRMICVCSMDGPRRQ